MTASLSRAGTCRESSIPFVQIKYHANESGYAFARCDKKVRRAKVLSRPVPLRFRLNRGKSSTKILLVAPPGSRYVLELQAPAGVWLFYVQHQFDPSYWSRNGAWHSLKAALQGSSYYKLPKILQWFLGNIGFHHIHHLRPKIPNYSLERCLKETRELQLQNPLTLWRSLNWSDSTFGTRNVAR